MPQLPAQEITFNPCLHEYRKMVGGIFVPSVTQILGAAGLAPDFSLVNQEVLEYKRNLGTQVHAATALDDRDDLGEYDSRIDGYVQAWRQFRAVFRFEADVVERMVYCPKYGFAGTLDRMGILQGNNALLDIKTGNASEGYVGPQTAAYLVALTGNERLTMPRFMVRLFDDGTYKLTPLKNKMDWQIFLNCLNLYRWKVQHRI